MLLLESEQLVEPSDSQLSSMRLCFDGIKRTSEGDDAFMC